MIRTISSLYVLVLLTCAAAAQQSNPLVGTWTLVSVNDERPDGSKLKIYGEAPSGLLIFDAQNRYSLQLCSNDRPKYASKDRLKGTPEEYKAAAIGCNPHWGRYTLDAAKGVIVFKIDHAIFGNWEGTEQNRSFKLGDGLLTYAVPNPPSGGANPVVTWKRAE